MNSGRLLVSGPSPREGSRDKARWLSAFERVDSRPEPIDSARARIKEREDACCCSGDHGCSKDSPVTLMV